MGITPLMTNYGQVAYHEGMEKAITATALKLLKMGIEIHSIMEATGLSELEINKLKDDEEYLQKET